MKPIKLIVKTGTQKYPILIGSNLISKISKVIDNNSIKFEKCLLIIDKNIVVEIKCLGQISASQRVQLLRYMRLPGIIEGILINFGPQQVDFFFCRAE